MLKYGYDSEKRKPRGDRKKGAGQSGQQGKEKKGENECFRQKRF